MNSDHSLPELSASVKSSSSDSSPLDMLSFSSSVGDKRAGVIERIVLEGCEFRDAITKRRSSLRQASITIRFQKFFSFRFCQVRQYRPATWLDGWQFCSTPGSPCPQMQSALA